MGPVDGSQQTKSPAKGRSHHQVHQCSTGLSHTQPWVWGVCVAVNTIENFGVYNRRALDSSTTHRCLVNNPYSPNITRLLLNNSALGLFDCVLWKYDTFLFFIEDSIFTSSQIDVPSSQILVINAVLAFTCSLGYSK